MKIEVKSEAIGHLLEEHRTISQMLSACSGRFKRYDLSTLHVAFLSPDDRDEFVRLLPGKMKPC